MACERKGGGAGAPVDLTAVLGIDIVSWIDGRLASGLVSEKGEVQLCSFKWRGEDELTNKTCGEACQAQGVVLLIAG